MEYLEKVCSSKSNNIPRKSILIPLANALNIDQSKFKNRALLINEIQRVCPASKRCENTEDFITLCPIDDIPKERLFIWTQFKKTFGADIVSLKKYIESGNTMNPWTIDYATGLSDAKNRELYNKTFDMSRQNNLISRIHSEYDNWLSKNDTESESESDDMTTNKEINLARFSLERRGEQVDQYVFHIITASETCDIRLFLFVISDTLKSCFNYFILQSDVIVASALETLFLQNELFMIRYTSGYIPEHHTLFLLDELITAIFDIDGVYTIGVVKYFFMSLEETLKKYNQLN